MGSFCSVEHQNDDTPENDVKLPKVRECIFCTFCRAKDHLMEICPSRNEKKHCLRRYNSF